MFKYLIPKLKVSLGPKVYLLYDSLLEHIRSVYYKIYSREIDSKYFNSIRLLHSSLHGENLSKSLNIAFAVTETSPYTTAGDYFSARGLGEALERINHWHVSYLPYMPINKWYELPSNIDVIIVMRDDYHLIRSLLPKKVIVIAWVRNRINRWLKRPWLSHFDMILASSQLALETLKPKMRNFQYGGLLRLAADAKRFFPHKPLEEYSSDICFVGNIFHIPRFLAQNLALPTSWRFRFWGRLEYPKHPFKQYQEGTILYENTAAVYSSAKIVLDDCTSMCSPWGCINLRIFEAMACGACVVTNDIPEIKKLFPNSILIYRDDQELDNILNYYLTHEKERHAIGEMAKITVEKEHLFDHRAIELKQHLLQYLNFV